MRYIASVILSLLAFSAVSSEATLNQRVAQVKTLSARFSQVVLDEAGAEVQTSSGELYLVKPDRFRWNYTQPFTQEIVGDGRNVWVHDPELEQVTVKPMDNTLASSPAALLSGDGNLEENFEVRRLDSQNTLDWFELTPRVQDSDFQTVRVGLTGNTPQRMVLIDALGQETRIQFNEVVVNASIDASVFQFTPPENADVIGEPALE